MHVYEEFIGNKDTIKKKITPVLITNKLVIQGREIPLPHSALIRIEYSDERGKILNIRATWK